MRIALAIAPFEFAGAALGLLLILRTNAGYDRWWEARIVWGGIVNQSRNLVIGAMAYGPNDLAWREKFVRWAACSPIRRGSVYGANSLRPEITNLVGPDDARRIATAGPHAEFRGPDTR